MANYAGTSRGNLGQYRQDISREEYLEVCRRGGRASQEKQKRKRKMTELANVILDLALRDGDEIKLALEEAGFTDEATIAAGVLFAQAAKAMRGDTEAARFIRDTSGQRPVEGIALGNLEDRPFETIDLAAMTDDELRALMAAKANQESEEE